MKLESIRYWTVAEILATHPQTAKEFIVWKTDCVGCYLSRFCTLEDVAATYSLDTDEVLAKIKKLITTPKERITQ